MNRYELAAAIHYVDGYFLPQPHETATGTTRAAFERARVECLQHMITQAANITRLTWEQFNDLNNRKTGD